MEHRPKRSLIFLQLVRAVDIQTHINAVGPQTLANRPQQTDGVCSVVDDVESRDDVVLLTLCFSRRAVARCRGAESACAALSAAITC